MTTQQNNGNDYSYHYTFRFVTALIALIALLAAYLACWRITAINGVGEVINHVYGYEVDPNDYSSSSPWTPMPMIVRLDEPHPVSPGSIMVVRRYYFWYFFGAVALPFLSDDAPKPAIG